MENPNRTVNLIDPPLSDEEVRKKFYLYYKIPSELEWIDYADKPTHGSLKYICPNCSAELKAEWNLYTRYKCERIEVEQRCDSALDKYVDSYKIYIPQVGMRTLKNFTQKDYEEYQRICQELEDTFHQDYNKKAYLGLQYVTELSHCPICNSKLIKKYPFTEWNGSSFMYWDLEGWLKEPDWLEEWEQSCPIDIWKYNKALQAEYKDNFLSFKEEFEKIEFAKVYDNPALEKHAQYLQNCDAPTPIKLYKSEISVDFLKEYLLKLIEMESNLLCLSKRLEQLYLLREKNRRDLTFEQNFLLYNLNKEICQTNNDLKEAEQALNSAKESPLSYTIVELPQMPAQPIILKPNIFNRKKVELLNAQAQDEYQKAIEQYNLNVEKCKIQTEKNHANAEEQKCAEIKKLQENIEKYTHILADAQNDLNTKKTDSANILTKSQGAKQLIDAEITSAEEMIKNIFKCRNELYSYNVIFEKYRNIVAITSFYEYLMAGRCDSLEGVNGAYNIYENESRMDTIITKLDEIELKLDEIKSNQFMIYNKMKSIESSLYSLNNSMQKAISSLESIDAHTLTMSNYLENISRNTEVIALNTAVTAYYSKVNAELTNALGFMVAMS